MTVTGRISVGHKDSDGVVIREGQEVAYNMSGDVVRGIVVKATPPFRIRKQGNGFGFRNGHISRVRSSRSILVLKEPEA